MSSVLIWVYEIRNCTDNAVLVGEPLITTTGFVDDNAEFRGELITIGSEGKRHLSCDRLLLQLGVDAEMSWQSECKEFPDPPFLLTDSESKQILFDGQARLKSVSKLLERRLAGNDWEFAGFRFGTMEGVIHNNGGRLGLSRVVVVGEPNDCLKETMELRDLEESDEVLAQVEFEAIAIT